MKSLGLITGNSGEDSYSKLEEKNEKGATISKVKAMIRETLEEKREVTNEGTVGYTQRKCCVLTGR